MKCIKLAKTASRIVELGWLIGLGLVAGGAVVMGSNPA